MVMYLRTEKEIKEVLNHYGLDLERYAPGDKVLYRASAKNGGVEVSLNMPIKEMRAWAEGFVAAKEGY